MPDLHVVERFPHDIVDVEHVAVRVRDGVRLAARLWLPAMSGQTPVPAVLEVIPYRKRDGTRVRDEPMHRWFAGHGYAAVRVDVRGTGDSEGVLADEYTEQEQLDALDVLQWIAAQPWCNGRIGMIGKSWGGFGALQVAARRPPQLCAVIVVCASDDRYADDAHYMGGCLLNENLLWGSMLMALCAQPPDPELAGPAWRELWLARIAAIAPFPARWLRHPDRDDYWRHGSICEDFGAVRVPVWAISGWADGYSNAVLRLLAGLSCPRHGLIGPWAHVYPHEGVPGPAIGFLQEAVRFWDRWLRGIENGIEDAPRLRAWQQHSARPAPGWPDRAGRWIAEREWPSPSIVPRRFVFSKGGLVPAGGAEAERAFVHGSAQHTGAAAGAWCAFGIEGEHPDDQRADDARSSCFDSAPLAVELPLLGAPVVRLSVAVDRPAAFLCVRLCEVFPDGTSARVSFGLANLAHRASHAAAEAMPIGVPQPVEVRLNDLAHVFAAGNRIRLAISTAYWPMVWPSPEAATMTLSPAGCELLLPERPPRADDDLLPPFAEPSAGPAPPFTDLHEGGVRRHTAEDPGTGVLCLETELDFGPDGEPSLRRFYDIDLETGHGMRERFCIHPDDPLSACIDVWHRTISRRGTFCARVDLHTRLHADAGAFHFEADLVAHEGATEVARRQWREAVPRRLL
ncbi:MAG TPA: CocE/NonD family hydrolase [Planctomycetota bacterium]|nr:CocE/NonD family hydrolase [Planctomycetota bacterium]